MTTEENELAPDNRIESDAARGGREFAELARNLKFVGAQAKMAYQTQ